MTTREQRQADYERTMGADINPRQLSVHSDDTGRHTLIGDRVIDTQPTTEDPNP